MATFLLDTNVLLRWVQPNAPHHSAAVRCIPRLMEQDHHLVLASQVLIEFWVVATRPLDVNGLDWTPEKTEEEIRQILTQYPLVSETVAMFDEWRRLVNRYGIKGKRAHDARLVAFMNVHRVTNLLTFNTADFAGYDIISVSPEEIIGT